MPCALRMKPLFLAHEAANETFDQSNMARLASLEKEAGYHDFVREPSF